MQWWQQWHFLVLERAQRSVTPILPGHRVLRLLCHQVQEGQDPGGKEDTWHGDTRSVPPRACAAEVAALSSQRGDTWKHWGPMGQGAFLSSPRVRRGCGRRYGDPQVGRGRAALWRGCNRTICFSRCSKVCILRGDVSQVSRAQGRAVLPLHLGTLRGRGAAGCWWQHHATPC